MRFSGTNPPGLLPPNDASILTYLYCCRLPTGIGTCLVFVLRLSMEIHCVLSELVPQREEQCSRKNYPYYSVACHIHFNSAFSLRSHWLHKDQFYELRHQTQDGNQQYVHAKDTVHSHQHWGIRSYGTFGIQHTNRDTFLHDTLPFELTNHHPFLFC